MSADISSSNYLGFSLNGSVISVQLYSADGEALAPTTLELPCHVEGGPQSFLTRLGEMTSHILAETQLSWASIQGAGVAIPAPMNDEGILLDKAHLEHDAWKGWNAKKDIADYFEGRVVVVENDANAAAYGDYCRLPQEQRGGVIVSATVSHGIGGGLLVDGHIVRGQGSAGELGRLAISMQPFDYYRCGDWCSERAGEVVCGSVESFASTRAMTLQLKEIFEDPTFDPLHRHPLREAGRTDVDRPNFASMAEQLPYEAQHGEELSRQLYHLREEAIGRLFAAIGLVCDPHLFIVGGDILRRTSEPFRESFVQGVREHLERQLGVVKPYQVVASSLGADAAIFGAAMLARDTTIGASII